jgi:hypothetical protein
MAAFFTINECETGDIFERKATKCDYFDRKNTAGRKIACCLHDKILFLPLLSLFKKNTLSNRPARLEN